MLYPISGQIGASMSPIRLTLSGLFGIGLCQLSSLYWIVTLDMEMRGEEHENWQRSRLSSVRLAPATNNVDDSTNISTATTLDIFLHIRSRRRSIAGCPVQIS